MTLKNPKDEAGNTIEKNGNSIEVLYAEEFELPDFNEMIDKTLAIIKHFSINWVDKVYVDAANPAIISDLKMKLGERIDYDQMILT
jgi:hypothetical protein